MGTEGLANMVQDANKPGMLAGPKYWVELTDAERIETLRNEVMELQRTLRYVMQAANTAKSMSEQHQHGQDGKPLFPAHSLREHGAVEGRYNPLT